MFVQVNKRINICDLPFKRENQTQTIPIEWSHLNKAKHIVYVYIYIYER